MGFNNRVLSLVHKTEAHSDDELPEGISNSTDTAYFIKEKEGRSTKVKDFYRMLDKQHKRMAKGKKNSYKLANSFKFSPSHDRSSSLVGRSVVAKILQLQSHQNSLLCRNGYLLIGLSPSIGTRL